MINSKITLISVITLVFSFSLKAQDGGGTSTGPIGQHAETPEMMEIINHPYSWDENEFNVFTNLLNAPRFNQPQLNSPFVLSNIDQLVLLKDLLDVLPSHSSIKNTYKYSFGPDDVFGIDPCMFSNPSNNHRIEDKLSVNYKVGPTSVIGAAGGSWPIPIFDINVKNICNNTLEPVMYVNAQKSFGFGTNQPAATYHFATPDFQFGNSTKLMLKLTPTVNNESLTLSKNGYDLFKVNKDGKVFAREFEVTLASSFPDYVFANGYKLMSLDKLEAFILVNKHLPGIAPAAQYEETGTVNMGALQLQMLEKIEELTLYIIEQQKKIDQLEQRIEQAK